MTVALRPARDDDLEFLFELHRDALGPYVDAIWGWDDDIQREFFVERFDAAANAIVEVDGDPIGCLRVADGEESITLDYVALVPAWQRRGIGSELVREVQRRAAERSVPVLLSVLRPNPARGLYEWLGFRVVDEDDTRIRMEWRDRGDVTAQLGDATDRGAVAGDDELRRRRGARGG